MFPATTEGRSNSTGLKALNSDLRIRHWSRGRRSIKREIDHIDQNRVLSICFKRRAPGPYSVGPFDEPWNIGHHDLP